MLIAGNGKIKTKQFILMISLTWGITEKFPEDDHSYSFAIFISHVSK
jgi:Holliday junction resolvasome RuvABC endonuclease subunit